MIPDSCSRPADLFLPHWQGRPAAADVTVISPMQVLTLQGASTSQGLAIVVAEERKKALYSDACRSEDISFLPLAVETLGGWGSEALSFIKHLARLQALRLDLDQAVFYFSGCPYVSGGTMPPCGHLASLSPLRLLTESCNSTFLPFCSFCNSTSLLFVLTYFLCCL